jgi:hypothetical protein
MTDKQVPTADGPRQLLSTTRELTRRVRKAQRGTWFPLVLLGLVVAAATPFYRIGAHPRVTCGPVTVSGGGGVARTCFVAFGWPAFAYWIAALVLAYAVIAGFYLVRARRRGVGARILPYVMAGIAAVVLYAALWAVQQHLVKAYLQSRNQTAMLAVHGLNPLLAIGMALFVLAWTERSWALLVFAAGYLAAALLPNLYSITRLLAEHGWMVSRQWHFLPGLWLAGGVLLLGGAAFAVAERLRK